MMEGRVKQAIRLIAEGNSGTPLPLDKQIESDGGTTSVQDVLLQKYPPRQPPKQSSLIQGTPIDDPHPVIFDRIDAQQIRKSALKTDGAAGPSGLDAIAWKRMCTSFKTASADLCDALASTASYVDPTDIAALVSCRLIALDRPP